MNIVFTTVVYILLTLCCYFLSLKLFYLYKKAWLNPLFTGSILLVFLLLVFHVKEETYQHASSIFSFLLQLAVVSLALPLYKQWQFLKKHYKKIITGVVSGTFIGLMAVLVLSQIFHISHQLLASLIPRSVTLPIALTISDNLGGISSMTILFVVISALFSVWMGPRLFTTLGIKSKSAKGLAMGTSAQMIGANTSLAWGEEEGAMGSVAMTTSAMLLTIVVPVISFILS
ncbi:LrgB family protein [Mesobacillus maritimus]|uniref:LrgB family protein n=1 Tax=Mesobacillus maritimus TaxID=1643336 RepID=A0ABS7K198_9BACI|nr:LrgB family protein [Mesobacillus maritimus]